MQNSAEQCRTVQNSAEQRDGVRGAGGSAQNHSHPCTRDGPRFLVGTALAIIVWLSSIWSEKRIPSNEIFGTDFRLALQYAVQQQEATAHQEYPAGRLGARVEASHLDVAAVCGTYQRRWNTPTSVQRGYHSSGKTASNTAAVQLLSYPQKYREPRQRLFTHLSCDIHNLASYSEGKK